MLRQGGMHKGRSVLPQQGANAKRASQFKKRPARVAKCGGRAPFRRCHTQPFPFLCFVAICPPQRSWWLSRIHTLPGRSDHWEGLSWRSQLPGLQMRRTAGLSSISSQLCCPRFFFLPSSLRPGYELALDMWARPNEVRRTSPSEVWCVGVSSGISLSSTRALGKLASAWQVTANTKK